MLEMLEMHSVHFIKTFSMERVKNPWFQNSIYFRIQNLVHNAGFIDGNEPRKWVNQTLMIRLTNWKANNQIIMIKIQWIWIDSRSQLNQMRDLFKMKLISMLFFCMSVSIFNHMCVHWMVIFCAQLNRYSNHGTHGIRWEINMPF